MSGNAYWHTTDDELKYIRHQIGKASGLIATYTRAELLEGYIKGSQHRHWGGVDGPLVLDVARWELQKEQESSKWVV